MTVEAPTPSPPPGSDDPARSLGEELRLLDAALARLDDQLRSLTEAAAAAPAGGSRWSPRMHAEHAAKAAELSLRAAEKILDRAGDLLPGDAPRGAGARILRSGRIPRGVAEAPEPTRPTEDVHPVAAAAAIDAARARLAGLLARIAADPGTEAAAKRACIPHFALGPFDAAEWCAFARIHLEHHAGIAGL
jgi:hypothetical protein